MNKSTSIIRVALIGPESTGKTTLSKLLALHFNTSFVPEFSRTYVQELGRKYTSEDVLHCIREQFEMEKSLLPESNLFIFADTESIMGKVWMEDVFKFCPQWVEDLIEKHPYDLYLLTAPDLPFETDPVRENPHRRDFFFNWYEKELKNRKLKYAVIRGSSDERMQNAIRIIRECFGSHLRKT